MALALDMSGYIKPVFNISGHFTPIIASIVLSWLHFCVLLTQNTTVTSLYRGRWFKAISIATNLYDRVANIALFWTKIGKDGRLVYVPQWSRRVQREPRFQTKADLLL